MKAFAEEFFHAVGRVLISSPLEHLGLTHVEFERDPFNDDDHDEGYTFVPVVVSFDPEK